MGNAERLAEIKARADAATVEGFPDYEVHPDGSVWSNRNWRGYGRREITPTPGAGGYLKVRLVSPSGERVNRAVHRLMAEAFLGPRPEGGQIRHLNGVKTENWIGNLAYGTAAENAADRDVHGTTARGTRNGNARLTEIEVRRIRESHARGLTYTQVARQEGLDKSHVRRIVLREGWAHV